MKTKNTELLRRLLALTAHGMGVPINDIRTLTNRRYEWVAETLKNVPKRGATKK